jgi:hypothetical protein
MADVLSPMAVLKIEQKWRISPLSVTNLEMESLFLTLHHWHVKALQRELPIPVAVASEPEPPIPVEATAEPGLMDKFRKTWGR